MSSSATDHSTSQAMPVVSGNRAWETAGPVAVVDDLTPGQEWLRRMHGWMLGVATLVAFVTFFKAGLNPPGGNPWLHDLTTFHYCNTTALVGSVLIIVLLLNDHFYRSETKMRALASTTIGGLTGLLGACIVASKLDVRYSFFLIVPTCFVYGFVVYISTVLLNLKKRVEEDEEKAETIRRSSGRASAA